MSKLILQVQMTVDGYLAGPNGEMDWMILGWDTELKSYVEKLTDPANYILLSRNLAAGQIDFLVSDSKNPNVIRDSKEDEAFKEVIPRTLVTIKRDQTVPQYQDLISELKRLKTEEDGDILVYGGGDFISELVKEDMIDEYHIFMNPTALGRGMSIFKDLLHRIKLNLVQAKTFECGIVALNYVK